MPHYQVGHFSSPGRTMSTNMFDGMGRSGWRRERIISTPETVCPMCRRVRRMSGERRCAIHLKAATLETHHPEFDTKSVVGSSPPGVFVGRFGYPKVFVGPMVPPVSGDTEILDTPEWWMGKGFDEIVDFRYSLLRGYSKANVEAARDGTKLIDKLQEVAMMTSPSIRSWSCRGLRGRCWTCVRIRSLSVPLRRWNRSRQALRQLTAG